MSGLVLTPTTNNMSASGHELKCTPEVLLSSLTAIGSRALIHLPSKMSVSEGIRNLVDAFMNSAYLADETELIVVTFRKTYLTGPRISLFQVAQMSQALLNLLLSQTNRILIVEMATNWGHLTVPSNLGRILTVSTDYKSLNEFTETARFLTGPQSRFVEITPLDLTKYYGQIGYLLCVKECLSDVFSYEGYPVTIQLSSLQYEEYITRLQKEKSLERSQPFSAIQTTNFLYPTNLQKLHNIPREKRPTITKDLPISEGGWLTQDIIGNLPKYSPKLEWLIAYFRQNPGKHIVWSSFSRSNGVDVITSVLQLAGFSAISLTGTDTVRQRWQKMEFFNQTETSILVTNLYAFTGIQNVKSLIIMDQHAYTSVFNSFLREIATTSPQPNVTIIFLVAIGPQNQTTVEVLNYRIFAQMLISAETMLDVLKTGQLQQTKLETYRQAFEIPTLTLQDLQTELPSTFQRIYLE